MHIRPYEVFEDAFANLHSVGAPGVRRRSRLLRPEPGSPDGSSNHTVDDRILHDLICLGTDGSMVHG